MKLQLRNLNFTYPGLGRPALDDCSLQLDTASVTVLVGNNGAGKSTLIRLLTGQLYGYSGSYTLENRDADVLQGEWLAANRFGYVPDVPVLDPRLTGLESLLMAGSFRGMTRDETLLRLRHFREIFDLGEWLGNMVCGKYSKGMRKKVSLAIGFLPDPAFVFLDEPFDGLDPIAVYNLKRHLKERKARGLGSLLSSHLLDAAEKVADELIIMKGGRLAFSGAYRTLLENRPGGAALEEIYFEYFGG
ncbi:MAG TPA: ABC transporter ATP-binding protein [Fibrobacteria bacterium]|nr:ABC transporter ATP-binding protein [Fibrobacteria bacterium]